jgi:hypothetical protein
MTDIFRELEDDIRRDRLDRFWKNHGNKIIAAALVLVLAVAGWKGYEWRTRVAAEGAAAQFEEALRLSRDGKSEEAQAAFLALAAKAPASYGALGRLRAAAELGGRDAEAGATAFDALAADTGLDADTRELARLRAALLRIDGPQAAQARAALEPLARPEGPYRHTAREILGLSALKAGDLEAAGRWFDAVVTDPQTPQGLRGRVDIYLGLVRGGPARPAS